MFAPAVVFQSPKSLQILELALPDLGPADVEVQVEFTGISTGTERLLWDGTMPAFPGMGYPLVPGYETVGRVVRAGAQASLTEGTRVFVPGSQCFKDARNLFGGSAARLVVPSARALPIADHLAERGALFALAATAHHVASGVLAQQPDLIVGHGVLGRLIARLAVVAGAAPTVWETNPSRRDGAVGYTVVDPSTDTRRDYRCICDVSGDAALLDSLIARLAPGGEVVLAGFYDAPLSFGFPAAFMREARIRVAAQWAPQDLAAVIALATSGQLSLDGLITHHETAGRADAAYHTAFGDAACLKMVLDWRDAP
ncbi:chlorophyll synthesis pathway protein BchC [Rhodoferax sp.]|jgi:3-hydroxyethyl bacteriochlorophyllide a dehydrogenase|uniref:chlorophyll synthesis pathway protein BchC n=1 Tax=Rhodoferax sp. TaxID=50421 RepID=UPI003784D1FF